MFIYSMFIVTITGIIIFKELHDDYPIKTNEEDLDKELDDIIRQTEELMFSKKKRVVLQGVFRNHNEQFRKTGTKRSGNA